MIFFIVLNKYNLLRQFTIAQVATVDYFYMRLWYMLSKWIYSNIH